MSPTRTPEPPRLPLNPFARVELGDWSAWRLTIDNKTDGTTGTAVSVCTVKTAGRDEVVLVAESLEGGALAPAGETKHSRRIAPTLAEWFGLAAGTKIEDLDSAEEALTVAGKRFQCQRLRFRGAVPGQESRITVWLAKDAKVLGAVASRCEQTTSTEGGSSEVVFAMELTGFGAAGSVLFGADPRRAS